MRINLSNVGDQITDESLGALFSTYGRVQDVQIETNSDTGRSNGLARVDMPDESDAVRAIARLNGSIINGRVIGVRKGRPV